MTPITTKDSKTNSPEAVPPELQSAFDNLAFLRSAARGVLETCPRGENLNVAETLAVAGHLREANSEFQNIWQSLRTKVAFWNRVVKSVSTADLLSLRAFLNDNQISAALTDFIEEFSIDSSGRITMLFMSKDITDGPYVTEALENIPNLASLYLYDAPSDPTRLAKLVKLESLEFSSVETPNMEQFKHLDLKALIWTRHIQPGDDTRIGTLEIGPFCLLDTLETLSIHVDGSKEAHVDDFASLAKLPRLGSYVLGGVSINSNVSTALLKSLKNLKLHGCTIKDLSILESMPALKDLDLTGSSISCCDAEKLQRFEYPPSLVNLSLEGVTTDQLPALLNPLLKLSKFKELKIRKLNMDKHVGISPKARKICKDLEAKGVIVRP